MSCKCCHCSPCTCSVTEVVDCSGITTVTVKPACLTSFFKYAKSKCFSTIDGLLNIFCALSDIAAAIREYTDGITQKGYASGVILFSTDEGIAVVPNDVVETQHSKSPFNFKVLGIGVSTQDWNDCGTPNTTDSTLDVKFWDYTAGAQIGSTLQLTSTTLHDKYTDEGNTISDNISPGHVYGVKVTYTNTEGDNCALPKLDFYILVSPVDIVTEE